MRSIFATFILLTLFVFVPSYGVEASQAMVTLLDGNGSLIRGTSRYALIKGIGLQLGDIIELNDRALAQIEFGDGTAVALGEKSRVMYTSAISGNRSSAKLYMIQGVVKAASPKGATPIQIDSPLLNIILADTTAVMMVSPTEAQIFLEIGSAKLATGDAVLKIKRGEYCSRKAGQKPAILQRPPQTFISSLPIPFRDALPALLPKIGNRKAHLVKPSGFSYDEVEVWLDSTPTVRRLLVAKWNSKAHDPAFRKALIHNLKKHPEWDRVLFPEKYLNKTPKTGAHASN